MDFADRLGGELGQLGTWGAARLKQRGNNKAANDSLCRKQSRQHGRCCKSGRLCLSGRIAFTMLYIQREVSLLDNVVTPFATLQQLASHPVQIQVPAGLEHPKPESLSQPRKVITNAALQCIL